ncbi:streptomycin 6-kinase/streptomycin 6-kinase [Labedella gwakjiensis]|uniref:Streptomycin 6-kinase/streptomycin 6-kinase n=1 Tax=Labedella gwakjiensis TaxID=390269 RepID=A0A2P8GX80_9MICO|nr:aminoglycoside phosphotransferase family protein [Labedella gwakjiensis]PSL38564.1 streptomycin 6-kinase/streptomycin 6-kinase [Labedella gwakjiensis]
MIIAREDSRGASWIAELPTTVDELVRRWDLRVDGDALSGRVGLILPVRYRGTPAVLKVPFPENRERSEGWALRTLSDRACVRLFAEDTERHALLLERAGPAGPTATLTADEWIDVAASIASDLAIPAPADAPSLADTAGGWEQQLDQQVSNAHGLLSDGIVSRARETIRAVGRDDGTTLIHGDLHEGNVLAARRRPWLAIDPTAVRGPVAWDAFTVCLTRVSDLSAVPDPGEVLRTRLRRFCRLTASDPEYAIEVAHARAVSSLLHESAGGGAVFGRAFLERLVRTL